MPDIVQQMILSRFTMSNIPTGSDGHTTHVVPDRLKDKLLCHILLLVLFINNFSFDVTTLQKDLQLDSTRWNHHKHQSLLIKLRSKVYLTKWWQFCNWISQLCMYHQFLKTRCPLSYDICLLTAFVGVFSLFEHLKSFITDHLKTSSHLIILMVLLMFGECLIKSFCVWGNG